MRFPRDEANGRRLDWRTVALAAVIYGGWLCATFFHHAIPMVMTPLIGGWLIAWHGSLQHETIHGHPTRSAVLNNLIGRPPLALWLPYDLYRASHLAHHASEDMTRPGADPESRYLPLTAGEQDWWRIASASLTAPLLGRLVLGPLVEIGSFLSGEAAALARGDQRRLMIWSLHLLETSAVIAWLALVCRMSLATYLLAFVYPGAALALLRSFAEHRAAEAPDHRVAIVENARVLGLLFLNNNLHAVHHRHPGVPWHALPRLYRRRRASFVQSNGGLVYDGYATVFRRFLFAPHDQLHHPAISTLQGEGCR